MSVRLGRWECPVSMGASTAINSFRSAGIGIGATPPSPPRQGIKGSQVTVGTEEEGV